VAAPADVTGGKGGSKDLSSVWQFRYWSDGRHSERSYRTRQRQQPAIPCPLSLSMQFTRSRILCEWRNRNRI